MQQEEMEGIGIDLIRAMHSPLANENGEESNTAAARASEEQEQSEEMASSTVTEMDNETEKKDEQKNHEMRRRMLTPSLSRRGYAMAFLNVVLDTYGSLLTKEHGVGMTTLGD